MSLPRPEEITISDCTLRDGEQQAGVVFDFDDKLAIARRLDEARIPEIEAGMPIVSDEEKRSVKSIAEAGLSAKITCLARSVKADIDAVLECNVWGVRISLPTGYVWRKYMLKKSDEEIMKMGIEAMQYAKDHGLYVISSLTDFSRAEVDHLKWVTSTLIREARIDQVRLPDTVGCITPPAVEYLVRKLREVTGDVPIEIHTHNDFGLATANELAAVTAGAKCLSTTINGIGERAGNAPTEEVVLALRILYGIDLGIRMERLYELSQLVEKLSGVPVQPNKGVVGSNAFAHDTGEGIAGLLSNPFVSAPYLPEVVGQRRKILLGKKSGKHAIEWKLKQLGVSADKDQVLKMLEMTKRLGEKKKSAISEEDFRDIMRQVIPMTGPQRCG
jgi:isopropylmalate/homocitrate/citramalate synthase